SVAFSPDGLRLAAGSWYGTIKVWELSRDQESATLRGHARAVTSVVFSPDGTRLASASTGGGFDEQGRPLAGQLKVWDAASGGEGRHRRGLQPGRPAPSYRFQRGDREDLGRDPQRRGQGLSLVAPRGPGQSALVRHRFPFKLFHWNVDPGIRRSIC